MDSILKETELVPGTKYYATIVYETYRHVYWNRRYVTCLAERKYTNSIL